jgi:hypothetical protein
MTKAIIPREVAEAIECLTEELGIETIDVAWAVAERLLGNRIENAEINDRAQSIAEWIYATTGSMDVLMCALVNGYDVERTAAEKAKAQLWDYWRKLENDAYSAAWDVEVTASAELRGGKRTLEILAQEYPELADVLDGGGNE